MEKFSDLPQDILHGFAERLESIEDFVRFGGVCKSWQSVFANQKGRQRNFAPLLMLSTSEENNSQPFFNLSRDNLFSLELPQIELPQIKGRRCWGSPFGWLVTFGLDLNIHLFNPFSRAQLSLPPQPTIPIAFKSTRTRRNLLRTFFEKIVLSSNPSDSAQACVAMAIYGEMEFLAFAKPGEEAWTTVETPYPYDDSYQEVIFYNGQFYAITVQGYLMVCHIKMPHPEVTLVAYAPVSDGKAFAKENGLFICYYLVEISGELHFIQRLFDPDLDYHTFYFQVYKFDFHTKSWTRLYDLGHHALFLGSNTSFAISTLDYPKFKHNCIYFTDDHYGLYNHDFCDMGVYEVKEKKEEEEEEEEEEEGKDEDEVARNPKPIFFGDYGKSKFSRPLFIMPSLH